MPTKPQDCTICADMKLVLLQTQEELTERLQEIKTLHQEIENLKDTVPWRRIRALHTQARADRQRFKEATLTVISTISEILADYNFSQEAEVVSLQRVFAVAIGDRT